jgi:hypothetical protein
MLLHTAGWLYFYFEFYFSAMVYIVYRFAEVKPHTFWVTFGSLLVT